jgi:UDP-N-acetylglucosamine transferase subunit ALG13
VIFVTLGTHHQPFARLIEALDALPAEELVVQHGYSPAPLHAAEAVDFLALPDMLERMDRADVVIMHAGVGSILLARRRGHTPVVVPRAHARGEHVDDHQAELATALEADGKAIVVWDTADLAAAVARVPRRGPPSAVQETPLHHAVRGALAPQATG